MIVNILVHHVAICIPGHIFILVLGVDGIYIENRTILSGKEAGYRHLARNILNYTIITIIGFLNGTVQRIVGQAGFYDSLINVAAGRRYPLIVVIDQAGCLQARKIVV